MEVKTTNNTVEHIGNKVPVFQQVCFEGISNYELEKILQVKQQEVSFIEAELAARLLKSFDDENTPTNPKDNIDFTSMDERLAALGLDPDGDIINVILDGEQSSIRVFAFRAGTWQFKRCATWEPIELCMSDKISRHPIS